MNRQLFLSLILILSGSSRDFTKPISQKVSSHRNDTTGHQLRDQVSQSQGDVFQPEESISKESEATSRVEEFLNRYVSHNRTARDVNNPCIVYTEERWDYCRNKYVDEVHCLGQHSACYGALVQGYSYPACRVVIGYRQAKYISKCSALQIDCQCAT